MSKTKERVTMIHSNENAVTCHGLKYELGRLTAEMQTRVALAGLVAVLRAAKDPAAMYSRMLNGTWGSPAASKESVSLWHKAAATVHAMDVLKAAGVRLRSGRTVQDTEEFATQFAQSIADMSPWSREKTALAKQNLAVVGQHTKLSGAAATSMDGLFTTVSNPVVETSDETDPTERSAV